MKSTKSDLRNYLWALASAAVLLLNACSKTKEREPEVSPEKQYVLRDLRYFVSGSAQVDTTTLNLQDTTLLNPGNALMTATFASDLSSLVKTSHFEITNAGALPEGINYEHFQVNLPSVLNPDNSLTYTAFKAPFTTTVAQLPYKTGTSETLTVNVPARSRIVVNQTILAQNITCSFTATIEEKTTGQTYPVEGTWKGLLRYDNLSTKLTEQPL